MSADKDPQKMIHVIIGSPDEDNCPICRAHAKGKFDQVIDGAFGQVLVQELSLHDLLRCSCPLCVRARQEDMEG
jgi:hypothetical protein